jgi:hypothetical protein
VRPRKGDHYVVTTACPAIVLIQFLAPFTGGNERTLPLGLRFAVDDDPPAIATAVGATPEPYEEWEPELVPEKDRRADKYAGYSLVIKFDDLAKCCEKLGDNDIQN